ncbi:MAG: c-type cytochrome [Candidatus Eiseniibacteriota bacterium]
MDRIRSAVIGCAGGIVVAAVAFTSCTTARTEAPAMTQAEKIARGKVISYSSGCVDCHTPGTFYGVPDTTRMLSGSELGWEGPWGVTYPRNLTPDPETGIASWTEEDIINAFRKGHRPDKTPILPPMPWPAYAYMSDEDAEALAAYIKSLPPVVHKAPDRIPPGTPTTAARLTFPPPPEWDGRNLPPPPAAAPATN